MLTTKGIHVIGVMATVALAMILPVTASSLSAEEAVDCSTLTDVGDRMKCKHAGFLDEQEKLIGNLETHFGGVISTDNFDRLKKANARAKKANGRMDAKKFKAFGKKVKEPKNEEPEDPENPSQGSLLSANANEEDDTDLEFLGELEETYDDATASIKSANELMEDNGEEIASMMAPLVASSDPASAALTSYEPADACKASIDWLTFGRILTITIMKQVAVGLRGIADVADKGCNQDAAGFNAASACIVLEGAAAAMAIIVETADGIFSIVKWGIDSTSQQCPSSLSADLQEAKARLATIVAASSTSGNQLTGIVADVQDMKASLSAITNTVNSLSIALGNAQQQIGSLSAAMSGRFDTVETLLITPQGQRDDFPAK